MPKKIDPAVKERCVRQVLEQGATSEELAEIKELKAKVRRLEEDNEILRRASIFFAGELDPRNR